jgi:hypothetical protein
MEKTKRYAWTKEEIEILYDLAGEAQAWELAELFMKESRKRGIGIPRTLGAIKNKGSQHKIKFKGSENRWTAYALSKILHIHPDAITEWIRKKMLIVPLKSPGGKQYVITRKQMRKLAAKYPQRLRNCDPDGLAFVLEDDKLINLIKPTGRREQAVIYEVHDRVYRFPSIVKAAKETQIPASTIMYALQYPDGTGTKSYPGTFKRA